MKLTIAKLLSFLFHPMIISLGVFSILVFSEGTAKGNPYYILTICFIFSNFIPILTVFALKYFGLIDDLDASIKDQRQFPLLLGIGYSGAGFLALNWFDANLLTQGLMFCYMTNTIVTLIITRYWKISIHSMGVSGPVAALWLCGYQSPFIMGFVILGVSYSRVILKAHTPAQVSIGALFGFGSTYLQLNWLFL